MPRKYVIHKLIPLPEGMVKVEIRQVHPPVPEADADFLAYGQQIRVTPLDSTEQILCRVIDVTEKQVMLSECSGNTVPGFL